jgi:hypothetical protein
VSTSIHGVTSVPTTTSRSGVRRFCGCAIEYGGASPDVWYADAAEKGASEDTDPRPTAPFTIQLVPSERNYPVKTSSPVVRHAEGPILSHAAFRYPRDILRRRRWF